MNRLSHRPERPGFTIVELLVVISIIALLIAILLPAIGKARDAARVTQSQGNMRNLSVSNDTYAADWQDRQFTACPDDAGIVGGQGAQYGQQIGCMGQQLVGFDHLGRLWGWWCAGPLCPPGFPGDAGYWNGCFDYCFVPQSPGGSPSNLFFGSFRLPTAKAFNQYVGDRWYDKSFWAPNDVIPLRIAEKMFDYPGEFLPFLPEDDSNQKVAYSSYVWSPSKMYHPEVFGTCGYRDPGSFAGGFKSPSVGQCKFPDIATRMIEHHWLQNNESESNPSFLGDDPSWIFSQGYNSTPVCLFFDGHVAVKGVREAMDADSRARVQNSNNDVISNECSNGTFNGPEEGLWHRAGAAAFGHDGGYGYDTAYDSLVSTGMHMYTTDGIRGRDFLASE
ncbi:MAG: prepilin-type N-terminal cleavage/methylation domain-containing protein [Planctomycetota bacterium]|nr:prepilin-type N-terminal cleavage/methylation domain-containing protein [Planctomycetota bacterium]